MSLKSPSYEIEELKKINLDNMVKKFIAILY